MRFILKQSILNAGIILMIFPLKNLHKKFRDMHLMWKINLLGILIILLFTIIIYILILPFFENEKLMERKGKLKAVVNSTVSLIDHYEKSLRSRDWAPVHGMPGSIDEAKKEVLCRLRDMRYDRTEFFFIMDGDGKMIMHPLKTELEGFDMMDIVDPDGIELFRRMVMESQRDGETVVMYRWDSKYAPAIKEPQITYARYYWQWDWVVCSSLYIQDINDSMKELRIRTALYEIIAAAAAMALLFILVHFNFNRPLKKLLSGIDEIRNGNLSHRIDIASLDELGAISTEFNSMVNNLNISRTELIQSEKKFRDLTDMLPDIIYEADSDLRITYLNRSGIEITGYNEEDISEGVYLNSFVDKKDYDIFADIYNNSSSEKYFSRHKVMSKNGSSIYGENNMRIFRENGKAVFLRGIIRDISEKQKFEEQLIQSQKMETIGILAGGLAHDFNNVLGGIVSTLSLIKFELKNNMPIRKEDLSGYIDIMEKSGQRAADMVQQLLTLSRKRETEFLPVDLVHTISNVKKICENTMDKRIKIIAAINYENAYIHADPTQTEQILLNLCINAGHAMTIMRGDEAEHGGTLSISLEKIRGDAAFLELHPDAEEKDYWMISVGDTGIGMDTQTIAHIFVPFFTTKEKGAGTGLGLSMVYTLVQQHNGFINVYSEKGVGTTFNVYLPVYSGRNSCDDKSGDEPDFSGEGLILIIDDEEMVRKLAETRLTKCGYMVISAPNGEEGIKIFREKYLDIKAVLLDLAMPGLSGDMVYDRLKDIDRSVRVLLASGFRQDERVNAVLKKGVNMFIQKPYTLEKLAGAIQAVTGTGGGAA